MLFEFAVWRCVKLAIFPYMTAKVEVYSWLSVENHGRLVAFVERIFEAVVIPSVVINFWFCKARGAVVINFCNDSSCWALGILLPSFGGTGFLVMANVVTTPR